MNQEPKRRRRSSPVRAFALQILVLAESTSQPISELLQRRVLELEAIGFEKDGPLLRHLVLGVLRSRLRIDRVLGEVSDRTLESLDIELRNLLRLGVFQLSKESRIPAHAAVNESVRLARKIGHAGIASFTNGVLRAVVRRDGDIERWLLDACSSPSEQIAVATSHPQWLVERWSFRFGPETTRTICESNNLEPPIDLLIANPEMSSEEAAAILLKSGVEAIPLDVDGGLRLVRSGDLPDVLNSVPGFYVQSRLSQIVSANCARLIRDLLAERPSGGPDAVVLDACSAPGGKLIALARHLPHGFKFMAHDVSLKRRRRLKENLERLNLSEVEVVTDEPGLERLHGRCFCVLIDAPCSSLGVIGRHPEIRWRRTANDPSRLAAIQTEIVRRFSKFLEPDGLMVYSVCSFETEETTGIIDPILAEGHAVLLPPPLAFNGVQVTPAGCFSVPSEKGEDGYFFANLRYRTKAQ